MLQPLDFHRAEVQFFGQHLQVAGDDGRGYGHHLVRLRVDLHEHLAVPPVCRFHFRDNRLAREQLFLLRFVVAFQRRGFQDRIEDHIRRPVLHADKGEAGAALDRFPFLVMYPDGQDRRMAAVTNFVQNVHRQVFDHLLCQAEPFQCLIRHFIQFKLRLFHTLICIINCTLQI